MRQDALRKLASKNFYDGKNKIACKRAGEFPPALKKIKDEKKFINIIDRKTASDNFLTKNLHLTFMKFFDIVFMVSNTHRENTTGIFRFFAKFSFKT